MTRVIYWFLVIVLFVFLVLLLRYATEHWGRLDKGGKFLSVFFAFVCVISLIYYATSLESDYLDQAWIAQTDAAAAEKADSSYGAPAPLAQSAPAEENVDPRYKRVDDESH